MRIVYALGNSKPGLGQFWGTMIKLAIFVSAALALLAVTLIGLFIILPVMLAGGIALHFYLRRKLRQSQRSQARRGQHHDGVIDAEYTVIERH